MALDKTVYESQKEGSGTVSALINFESKIDGKVAEKGTILMNIVATKSQGEWKITQGYSDQALADLHDGATEVRRRLRIHDAEREKEEPEEGKFQKKIAKKRASKSSAQGKG